MSYFSLFIAYLQSRKSDLVGDAWWDLFLDKLVGVEAWFYHLSWFIWAVLLVVGIAVTVWFAYVYGKEALLGMGCIVIAGAVIILAFPFFEWATWQLAIGMADSVTPDGVVNQGKLIMSAILYFLIGAG